MNNHLDYDKIAPKYDSRYTNSRREGILNALRGILSQEHPNYILEVGCGTCHWLKGLRAVSAPVLWGVDISMGMLKKAGTPSEIYLCQSTAEKLPFDTATFQFVYCVNALHHFNAMDAFFKETHRVLQKGRKIAIVGMDPREKRNSWYIYEYFDGTYEWDLLRYPSWAQVKSWCHQAGFCNLTLNDVEIIDDPKFGENVFADPFLQKNGCSQLALLSEKEYKTGLQRVQQKINIDRSETIKFNNHIILSMMTGIKD